MAGRCADDLPLSGLYSAQVAALAEETGSPLVDVRRLYLDKTHPHPYKRLIDDGIHPSAEGHELIYQAFDQFMKQGCQRCIYSAFK